MFLWLVSNIKVSDTASYVMGKCQTDVSMSVLCDPKGSMESPCDEDRPRDNAVSLYLVEISQFSHVGEVKVFNCDVWKNNSVPPKLCDFFVFKIILVIFFVFSPFHGKQGFQAYLPAKQYFCEISQHVNEYMYKNMFKNRIYSIDSTK